MWNIRGAQIEYRGWTSSIEARRGLPDLGVQRSIGQKGALSQGHMAS